MMDKTSHAILDPALAARIEKSDLDYTFIRLDGMRRAPGNPLGIAIERFGDATAFAIRCWPDFWYGNKVTGVSQHSLPDLEKIVAFFAALELDFRIEITPLGLDSKLARELHRLKFAQMSFSTGMYGVCASLPDPGSGGSKAVRQVQAGELDRFIHCYQDGFELPRLNQFEIQAVRSWIARAGERLYLCVAVDGGEMAGIAVLYVHDSVGLLADACVKPDHRGAGLHAALIQHRIRVAKELGCQLLTSFVEFGGTSHRNLERFGLRVAYTKGLWWRV